MKPVPPVKSSPGQMLPLMDVVFLLLTVFIFMIAQMRPDFGISVELPDVRREQITPPKPVEKKTVVVSVTRDNRIFVEDQAVALPRLASAIRTRLGSRPARDATVILRGDEKADYGRMIELFTILRKNELKDVLFDVDVKPREKAP